MVSLTQYKIISCLQGNEMFFLLMKELNNKHNIFLTNKLNKFI